MTIKIINPIKSPRWKEIPCKCNHDSVETEYPIAKCIHCECQHQQNMIPTKEFDMKFQDDEGNITNVHVNKIKLQYNDKYQNIIGWSHVG